MYIFKFADIGEGVHEGKIAEIFVKEGDEVKDGTDLFLVETDKITTEVSSPIKGVISKILCKVGDNVHVGQPLFEIEDSATSTPVETKVEEVKQEEVLEVELPTETKVEEIKTEEPKEEASTGASVVGEVKVSNNVLPLFGSNATSTPVVEEVKEEKYVNTNVTASPLARMVAKEKGIDLSTIKGTGPLGRILVADLDSVNIPSETKVEPTTCCGANESCKTEESLHSQVANSIPVSQDIIEPAKQEVKSEPVSVKSSEEDTIIEMTSIRKAISNAMKQSWGNVAYTNLATEIDVTELWDQRNKIKDTLLKNEGVKLNLLPFIVKAVAKAMKTYPNFNALIDEKTNSLVVKKQVNIGIAIDTKDGLIVPNVKDVNNKSVIEISKEISTLAEKARSKKIQMADLNGGTISVTNYGSLGVSFGVPVIKYPEVAIVGIGTLESKIKKVGLQMVERKVMYLTVAADHRWVDGGDIARFLSLVKEYLENITLLFI